MSEDVMRLLRTKCVAYILLSKTLIWYQISLYKSRQWFLLKDRDEKDLKWNQIEDKNMLEYYKTDLTQYNK